MINPKLFNFFGWNPTGDFGPWTFYTAKNKKPVMFIKAPPTSPPTDRQSYHRHHYKMIATLWKSLTQEVRDRWELATKQAGLFLTGYNLYVWWQTSQDRNALETIERQSKVNRPH